MRPFDYIGIDSAPKSGVFWYLVIYGASQAPFMVSSTWDNPSPELPWPRWHFTYFFAKFNQLLTIGSQTRLGGEARQLGWASCLASAGRVTLAGGTTFLHINTLARLTETILGVSSVTKCLNIGFKDVRANCFCRSLLRTKIHATSCMSARALSNKMNKW